MGQPRFVDDRARLGEALLQFGPERERDLLDVAAQGDLARFAAVVLILAGPMGAAPIRSAS
jgi:hypothetical protein